MSVTDAGRTPAPSPTEPKDDRPIGELVGELTSEASSLFSAQLELAKLELKEDAKRAAKGAGMFGGAAIAGLLTLILLSFAAAWGLSEIVPEGVAFLIVGLVWAAFTGILALTGKQRIQEIQPAPKTIETLKEDAQWVRQQKS